MKVTDAKWRYALALAGVVALVCLLAPACAADDSANAKLPAWKPDPKIAAGLGPDYTLYGYAVRIPGALTLTHTRVTDKSDARLWEGITYPNGFRSVFLIVSIPLKPDEVWAAPLSKVQSDVLIIGQQILASELSDWIQSSNEVGLVGEHTFNRLYFKAYDQDVFKEIHGFAYTTATDRCVFGFFAADTEPYNKLSLPTFEAAVLTFHESDAATEPIPPDVLNKWPVPENNDE